MNWTEEEHDILRREYSDTPTKELAAKLGRSDRAVYFRAYKLGLYKSDDYLREHVHTLDPKLGEKHRFRKGQEPWNAGREHRPEGSDKGWFKKGQKPHTWRPIGSERYDREGHKLIKVTDTKNKRADWKPERVIVWERHHGPVPKGMMVACLDRNPENTHIDNLKLMNRAELMEFNSVHRYPPEMKHAMKLVKQLNREVESEEQNV